jgi:hypothetical protein
MASRGCAPFSQEERFGGFRREENAKGSESDIICG